MLTAGWAYALFMTGVGSLLVLSVAAARDLTVALRGRGDAAVEPAEGIDLPDRAYRRARFGVISAFSWIVALGGAVAVFWWLGGATDGWTTAILRAIVLIGAQAIGGIGLFLSAVTLYGGSRAYAASWGRSAGPRTPARRLQAAAIALSMFAAALVALGVVAALESARRVVF